MKFKLLFWFVFILNLISAIIIVNYLPFKSKGEQTGFILSTIVLFLIPYSILLLFFRLAIWKNQKNDSKNGIYQESKKLTLYIIPIIAFYGVINLMVFELPKAINQENFMRLNSISMALGLLFGAFRTIYLIRK